MRLGAAKEPIGNESALDALDSRKAKHQHPAKLNSKGPANPTKADKRVALPHTKKRRKGELKRMPKPPGGIGSGLISGAYAAQEPAINRPARAQKKF